MDPWSVIMGFETWKNAWLETAKAIELLPGCSVKYSIAPPASNDDVANIQKAIGVEFPRELGEFWTGCTSAVNLMWSFSEPIQFDDVEGVLDWGNVAFDLSDVVRLWDIWDFRRDAFDHWENYACNYPKRRFDELFPIIDVENGDLIVIATRSPDLGSVYYQSHCASKMDWCVLGSSFEDFMNRWCSLACVGPDDDMLLPFYDFDRGEIDINGERARLWREYLGLSAT